MNLGRCEYFRKTCSLALSEALRDVSKYKLVEYHNNDGFASDIQKERPKAFPLPEGLTKGLEKVRPAARRSRKRPTYPHVSEVSHPSGRTNVAPKILNIGFSQVKNQGDFEVKLTSVKLSSKRSGGKSGSSSKP